MGLKRKLELHSYQTAWAMLARLRSVVVNPDRTKLSGVVEVDETFYGGHTPGQRGGRQHGAKLPIIVAVERTATGLGRCRMVAGDRLNRVTLRAFLLEHIEPGSTVVTDGYQAYRRAVVTPFIHQRHVAPGAQAVVDLPGVHRLASLFKRWMLGTH
jgi:transposase-like protein